MTTIHENNPDYFRRKQEAAKTALERWYWGRRLKRSLDLEAQLAARAKTAAKLKQREDNLNSFANLSKPKIEMDSKHPNGCIISWVKPADWEPDTYMLLVRGSPLEDWRSVASSNISWETRSQVLTKSYLAWGEYKEPYYICVAAVKNGVGRKESDTLIYPPDYKMPPLQPKPDPFADRHPGPAEELDTPALGVFTNRANEIQFYLRNFTGRRTRSGRPYIGDFRKHCKLNPRVGYKEMRNLWKQIHNAETGD